MAIKNDRQADPRRYNEPRVSEVAIVFDNFDGEPPFNRDILIHQTYYIYRMSVREEFNPILHAGRLTQQYIVDSYVKMEANRLNYLKTNQPKLRVDKYSGFVDHIHGDENAQPGKAVILPSTFEGSPRNYQQRYQDAMAMVTIFGKPDFL